MQEVRTVLLYYLRYTSMVGRGGVHNLQYFLKLESKSKSCLLQIRYSYNVKILQFSWNRKLETWDILLWSDMPHIILET